MQMVPKNLALKLLIFINDYLETSKNVEKGLTWAKLMLLYHSEVLEELSAKAALKKTKAILARKCQLVKLE